MEPKSVVKKKCNEGIHKKIEEKQREREKEREREREIPP